MTTLPFPGGRARFRDGNTMYPNGRHAWRCAALPAADRSIMMTIPKQITHVRLYLTQNQTRRLLQLLDAKPRKADTTMARHIRRELERAARGDAQHAEWLARGGRASGTTL